MSKKTAPAKAAAEPPYEVPPGSYQGTELTPYNGRPNAMDAFALPSLFMGRLSWRDGRKEVLQ